MNDANIEYCDDSRLDYKKYQTDFVDGESLIFDDAYRLAHLPLVAPHHPRVIPTKPGSSYDRGVHELVFSIVLPVPYDHLDSSDSFNELYNELKAATFTDKLSWDTFDQRKNKLHATLCGTLSTRQPPAFEVQLLQTLAAMGPVSFSLRGLFSGNINIGRLYLKVYPELRAGQNRCHEIQTLFGTAKTDLYLVGLFNLKEQLDASETRELSQLLQKWQDVEFTQIKLDNLWLLKSRDDLVLDGGVEQIIPLKTSSVN